MATSTARKLVLPPTPPPDLYQDKCKPGDGLMILPAKTTSTNDESDDTTILPSFPTLRRTYTDVLEDSLFTHDNGDWNNAHWSNNQCRDSSSSTPRYQWTNSPNSVPSPTRSHSRLVSDNVMDQHLSSLEDNTIFPPDRPTEDRDTTTTANIDQPPFTSPFRDSSDYFNNVDGQRSLFAMNEPSPAVQPHGNFEFQLPGTVFGFPDATTFSPKDAHLMFTDDIILDGSEPFPNVFSDSNQVHVFPNNETYPPLMERPEAVEDFDDDASDVDNYFDSPFGVDQSMDDKPMEDNLFLMGNNVSRGDMGMFDSMNASPLLMESNSDIFHDPITIEQENTPPNAESQSFSTFNTAEAPVQVQGKRIPISAGSHTCEMINPSTGKPCLKHFSRPYDLIRHKETIHASKKKIFICELCENEGSKRGVQTRKTFSRGDALSRHIRVKHLLSGNEAIEAINRAKANAQYIDMN